MNFFRVSVVKDIARLRRDPLSIVLAVMLPLLIGSLLTLISGGNSSPTARLLIADHDESVLSGFLITALGQGPLEDLVVTEAVSDSTGRARMDNGEASGMLIIPEGFGADVLKRNPTSLVLKTNPAQRILPGILEQTLSLFTGVINAAHQILGPDAQTLLDQLAVPGQPSDELVAAVSVTVNQLMTRVEPYLLPPAIEIKTTYIQEATANRSMAELFFPSMFFLAIIFAAQGMSDDVWRERMRGTLRRAVSTPGSLSGFLLAKITASCVVLGIVSTIALLAGRWLFRIPLANLPLAVVWAVVASAFMLVLFTTIQMLSSSQRGGNMLTNAILFPLVMVGGSFFPFEAMPEWMAAIGRMTPNGWALERFKDITAGNLDPMVLATTTLLLLGVGTALFFVCVKRLSVFARSV